jgi:hypothetical protein
MTSLVQQRSLVDCGVCCLAMAAGRRYDDVVAAIGDCFDPANGMRRTHTALKRLGFDPAWSDGQPGDVMVLHLDWCLSPQLFLRMAWGRRAILSVPSLNQPDTWHMVYSDGRELFDPSTRRTHARFADMEPRELVLFREG